MGQSISRETPSTSSGETPTASGVALAADFEESIVRDFQNQALQEEWNKVRNNILIRRNEREQHEAQLAREQEQLRHSRTTAQAQRMRSLDETIDKYRATFADEAVALEYDVNRLSEKFMQIKGVVKDQPLPCLGPRAHWIDCTKKYKLDTQPCEAYLLALEKCVNKTIVKANEK